MGTYTAGLRPRLLAGMRNGGLGGALLLLVVAAAMGVRLYGLDWDGGGFYHPDERSILMRADCMYRTLTSAPGWETCGGPAFPRDTPGFPSIGTFFDA
ncbi:MAG: hypothetical protein WD645_05525, partial [Dehalococcoidia bacterium]